MHNGFAICGQEQNYINHQPHIQEDCMNLSTLLKACFAAAVVVAQDLILILSKVKK